MNNIEINIKGKIVKLYGSNSIIEKEKPIIEKMQLTGNEYADRLIIQQCIDDNKLKSDISYDGNTVYPFEKTIKEYRKLQKNGTLDNMSKYMYDFFMNACGDIAHYNIDGYKSYYNYSMKELENQLLRACVSTTRYSDVDKIFKELKIGKKYFHTRDTINIDEVSINKLKAIIKECGWNIRNERYFLENR